MTQRAFAAFLLGNGARVAEALHEENSGSSAWRIGIIQLRCHMAWRRRGTDG